MGTSRIGRVGGREVLDSRGRPTVEVEITTDGGCLARAMVPSGASTGAAECLELRDGDPARYDGQGVRRAVDNVCHVPGPAVVGLDVTDQRAVDQRLLELDATPQKTRLGGNSLLGVSLAVARAAAAARQIPLYRHFHELLARGAERGRGAARVPPPRMPLPMTNMISGGLHAGGNLDFQDILITPVGAPDYPTGLEWIVRVYRRLGGLLSSAGYEGWLVGDEGGYGPRLKTNRAAVSFVVQAVEAAGLRPGSDVTVAIDVAATHFYRDGAYHLVSEGGKVLNADGMIDLLAGWVDEFPVTSIEDGLAEDDWTGWQRLTARLGGRLRLVGDDFFTTNPGRLKRGIESGAANSVLIKVNQIGTLSEALDTIHVARSAGYSVVVSARSGETEDDTLADLAVGVAADQIKIGSIVRSERLAKYNQLLRIAEQLAAR
ncbi:MAG: phosphopyruvate hydratase [Pirellulaceae bacterium]